jgi:hypothetical protein
MRVETRRLSRLSRVETRRLSRPSRVETRRAFKLGVSTGFSTCTGAPTAGWNAEVGGGVQRLGFRPRARRGGGGVADETPAHRGVAVQVEFVKANFETRMSRFSFKG